MEAAAAVAEEERELRLEAEEERELHLEEEEERELYLEEEEEEEDRVRLSLQVRAKLQ